MTKQTKLVVAVSGGIDSVSLLDALANHRIAELTNDESQIANHEIVVAHFDHGIRPDSKEDSEFVKKLADQYGLTCESKRVELGSSASEDLARRERYNFLRDCCKKYNASLVTAHHQDDLVETAIINLLRGTGWRGLAPMSAQRPTKLLRPLLDTPKSTILDYAKKYNLQWREDSTNNDQTYLRNYVRQKLIPTMQQQDADVVEKFLKTIESTTRLKKEITTELQSILYPQISNTKYQIFEYPRYSFIMWPSGVAREVIYQILTNLDPDWHPTTQQLERALHFIKTGRADKDLIISKHLKLSLKIGHVQFKKV